jgi:hypothetical protein
MTAVTTGPPSGPIKCVLRLQEAGGWSSLAMPRRYVEESEIANEGMA